MILLYAVIISLLASLVFGGKLSRLGDVTLRYGWLGLLSVALQLIIISVDLPEAFGPWSSRIITMLMTYGLLIVMLLANTKLPGFWWIGLGMALNLTAIIANKGWMPVSPKAIAQAGLSHLVVTNEAGAYVLGSKNVVLAHRAANLWFLGDVFVLRIWHAAFSVGDIVLAAGAFLFFWRQMRSSANAEMALIDS